MICQGFLVIYTHILHSLGFIFSKKRAIILISMAIPQTKKENIVDEINGISITDPYRWLEDNNSKEVADWISAQNQYTP
jgi:hypothetical protein